MPRRPRPTTIATAITKQEADVVEVFVEVSGITGKARMMVWEASCGRALWLAGGRLAGVEAGVLFPIDPETFFAGRRPEERVRT